MRSLVVLFCWLFLSLPLAVAQDSKEGGASDRSAIPLGTKLQALFITNTGEAFVDVSPEIMFAHPGGSLNEMLTIYTLVDALTANMPAVTSVQLLVNGKEIETLAGHVDLRRPLARNMEWVETVAPATPDAPATPNAPAPPAEPTRPTQTP